MTNEILILVNPSKAVLGAVCILRCSSGALPQVSLARDMGDTSSTEEMSVPKEGGRKMATYGSLTVLPSSVLRLSICVP